MTIEELVSQTYELRGHGRWLRAVDHDSLVVDTVRQLFFWNSRGLRGNAYRWLTDVIGMSPIEAKKIVSGYKKTNLFSKTLSSHERTIITPDSDLVETFYLRGKNNREYWYNVRGYTDETIKRFKLGYTGEWYTIPIYVDGVFKNFQCLKHNPRRRKAWYKGLGALPFNFSNLAVTDWVVLTEGPVDAIMLRQYDIPAVSQTGGSGTWKGKWSLYFRNMKRIFIVYDNDIAGNHGCLRPARSLGTERVKIYNFWDFDKGFDITDYFKTKKSRDDFLFLLENSAKSYWEAETTVNYG